MRTAPIFLYSKETHFPTPITRRTHFQLLTSHLTLADQASVQNELCAVRGKWYSIGLLLGYSESKLHIISVENNDDPARCFSDLICQYLKDKDHKPTWRELADIMASPLIGYRGLAEDIHRKHLL